MSSDDGFDFDGFKGRLRDELHAEGGGVSSGLAADSLVHGRRLRRRQRQARILGGTGAVAAVAVGAVVLSGQVGAGPGPGARGTAVGPGVAAGTGSTAPGSLPSSRPSPTPSTVPSSAPSAPSSVPSTNPGSGASSYPSTPPGGFPAQPTGELPTVALPQLAAPVPAVPPANGVPATVQAYAAVIASLLPTGTVTMSDGEVRTPGGLTDVSVQWKVGDVVAKVEVFFSKSDPLPPNTDFCRGDAKNGAATIVDCAYGTLSDGSQVSIRHLVASPANSAPHLKQTEVTLHRPDGTVLELIAGDGPAFGSAPHLATFPLTDQQAYAIVADPRWTVTLDPAFVQHADTAMPYHWR